MFRRNGQQHVTRLDIDHDKCYSCGACVAVCPPDSLFLSKLTLQVDDTTCTRCNRCVAMCPVHALALTPVESLVS
ncbi:2-oxoglutarate ferredoxin oxidoreductase subunit delta [uncultured bacterium]|nr:2-oxoglutarate ferredoxin oxidoreductase subunit delta [uncultured bacterium]